MTEEKFDLKKFAKKVRNKYSSIRIPEEEIKEEQEFISTGNKALDLILEGGILVGYASEFSGFSGSGKTLILQLLLANMQKKYNASCIWLDRENAFFPNRAKTLGIDLNKVILIPPQDIVTVPDATSVLEEILPEIPEDEYLFIAIDSISAFAKEGEKADMGKKAQSLHNLFRLIIPRINKRTSFNFANQKTYKVGVMFGPNTTVTGGESPKFYCTYRINLNDLKSIRDDKKGGEIVGTWIEATVIKTRLGPNYRKVVFPFYFQEGLPYYGGYARLLVDRNYLTPKNKAEFLSLKQVMVKFDEETFSEHNIEQFLEKHPELDFNEFPEYKLV